MFLLTSRTRQSGHSCCTPLHSVCWEGDGRVNKCGPAGQSLQYCNLTRAADSIVLLHVCSYLIFIAAFLLPCPRTTMRGKILVWDESKPTYLVLLKIFPLLHKHYSYKINTKGSLPKKTSAEIGSLSQILLSPPSP